MTPGTIDIGVCTFRRPQLADTLRSLAGLDLAPGWSARLIVVDNDETAAGRESIEAAARLSSLPFTYVHAPARNISIARNACLEAATAPLLAFIDDDEIAEPRWLMALLEEMQRSGADAVLGPVRAIYAADAPAWMRAGDFHSTKPEFKDGAVSSGYSGNALLRLDAKTVRGRRFRLDLGRSGGEDTEFFAGILRDGGHVGFAPDAMLSEVVLPQRARFDWLLRRRFRAGQTHAVLLLQESSSLLARFRNVALASAKALFCGAGALLHVFDAARFHRWLLRGALHVGVVAHLAGLDHAELYG